MERDPFKGNLFENLVIMELVKKRLNLGLDHNLYFYRDSNGNEVDVIYISEGQLVPVEIKSAATFNKEFLKNLDYIGRLFPEKIIKGFVVYSGKIEKELDKYSLVNYKNSHLII